MTQNKSQTVNAELRSLVEWWRKKAAMTTNEEDPFYLERDALNCCADDLENVLDNDAKIAEENA